ncbi:MAG: integrase arm-type DNA-binding domain-containing protein [Pseudomonadota bacterium]|nr:integrase arm-type DNA-binding domain-containing protein [Pseudomonadota bacterium]
MPLTDIKCKNAKPKEKAYKLSDAGGLYLFISKAGNKIWRMKYRFPKGGKEKVLVIGEYPLISLSEAREKQMEAKKLLADNIDPMATKKEELQNLRNELSNTFKDVALNWFEFNKHKWTERNAGYVQRRLEQKIFPHIGNVPITQLKRKQIIEAIRHTEEAGSNDLAHRLAQYCKQICSYAVHEELIDFNPALELTESLKKYKKEHHAALEAHEIPTFLRTLEKNDARLYATTRYAIKLLMLTFVRTNELINARWEEVDFKNAQWTIPAERMKTRLPHIVPLSRQSLELFQLLHELHGNREFVFPNQVNPRKTMSNSTILRGLYQMGYKGKLTGHGFRATAMSAIQEKLGYRYEVVDRQLAHAPKTKVQAAYDRAKFLDERTKMMQEWADYLDECAVSGQIIKANFGG